MGRGLEDPSLTEAQRARVTGGLRGCALGSVLTLLAVALLLPAELTVVRALLGLTAALAACLVLLFWLLARFEDLPRGEPGQVPPAESREETEPTWPQVLDAAHQVGAFDVLAHPDEDAWDERPR